MPVPEAMSGTCSGVQAWHEGLLSVLCCADTGSRAIVESECVCLVRQAEGNLSVCPKHKAFLSKAL